MDEVEMDVVERTPEKVVLSCPFTWDGEVTDSLWWEDLYVYGDVVGDNPRVVYMVDTREMRLYWGYVGDVVFLREPQPEEGEILELLGYPPFSPAE